MAVRPALWYITLKFPPRSGAARCHGAQEFTMHDRWLSVDEIAEYLGISKDTVYAWVADKQMPGHKVGRFWKFKREDVDDWVRAGGPAAPASSGSEDESEGDRA